MGRSTGIALMAPPTDSATAQKTLDTLLSAVNKKQKVACAAFDPLYTTIICDVPVNPCCAKPKYYFTLVVHSVML